jgi:hypothetical protein
MNLTARQCLQIACVYEKAAADAMNVPRQQRTAFTRKARWFHMLARIKTAKEAAVAFRAPSSQEPGLGSAKFNLGAQTQVQSPAGKAAQRKNQNRAVIAMISVCCT